MQLYTTNSNIVKEFAIFLINTFFFPSLEEKQYLSQTEFVKRMEDSKYAILKPYELRRLYTEYVFQNRQRAMLPSKSIRSSVARDSSILEESKDYESDFKKARATRKSRGTMRQTNKK